MGPFLRPHDSTKGTVGKWEWAPRSSYEASGKKIQKQWLRKCYDFFWGGWRGELIALQRLTFWRGTTPCNLVAQRPFGHQFPKKKNVCFPIPVWNWKIYLQKYMTFKSSSHQNMLQMIQAGAEHFGWKPILKGSPASCSYLQEKCIPLQIIIIKVLRTRYEK